MSDDPIKSMLDTIRAQRDERVRNERRQPAESTGKDGINLYAGGVTWVDDENEELLYRRLERLLRDQSISEREIWDFRAEFESAGDSFRNLHDDVEDALEAKLDIIRNGSNMNNQEMVASKGIKNKGGAPIQKDWDAFWCHIVELADTPDGLPDRAQLQRHMMDWCADKWGDAASSDSTVRDKLAKLF